MENYLQYLVPVIAFIIVSFSMYTITPDSNEKKNDSLNILARNILPGISVALLVFIILRKKEQSFNNFGNEQLMQGNYFD